MSTTAEQRRAEPYCGNCGYVLTGLTESSKCPECGRPLVEVLMRPAFASLRRGRRYRSGATLFGMPAIDIAFGPHEDEPIGRARGFIAMGDSARGVVALGGRTFGVVSIGGMAVGVFSLGGMSIGLLGAIGGLAIGGLAAGGGAIGGLANGGGAAGFMAQGGGAAGYFARGGGAAGVHTIDFRGPSGPEAQQAFDSMSWFFGAWPSSTMSLLGSAAVIGLTALIIGALLAAFAWVVDSRFRAGDGEPLK